mgnify:CR=1 FL=1
MLFLQLLFIVSYANDLKSDTKMLIMEQSPYGYISKSGKTTGILYEIMGEILSTSGINSSIYIIPSNRLITTMSNNEKVCTLAANTPDVSSFDLIEPVGFKFSAGILPASGIKLNNYSNLNSIVIAVPLGVMFDEKFHNDDSLTKVRPHHYINAVKMLQRGRIDAIAGAIHVLKFLAKNEGMSLSIFGKPLILFDSDVYLVCTKSVEKYFQNKLKESLIHLKNNGKIQVLLDSYFGKKD